jgi:cytochrome o ubiquinol oxidase subunit 2
MNSFYVPALAGQVYSMAGMQTMLHAVINKEGAYKGFSANFSGPGFSYMHFEFLGLSQNDFDAWIAKASTSGTPLGRTEYLALEKPSVKEPVRYFKAVDPQLYQAILNMCVDPAKMCMHDMMHVDMKGGGGKDSHATREKLEYDNRHSGSFDPGHAGHAVIPADPPPPDKSKPHPQQQHGQPQP